MQVLSYVQKFGDLDKQLRRQIPLQLPDDISSPPDQVPQALPSAAIIQQNFQRLAPKLEDHENMLRSLLDCCDGQIKKLGCLWAEHDNRKSTGTFTSALTGQLITFYYDRKDISMDEHDLIARIAFID